MHLHEHKLCSGRYARTFAIMLLHLGVVLPQRKDSLIHCTMDHTSCAGWHLQNRCVYSASMVDWEKVSSDKISSMKSVYYHCTEVGMFCAAPCIPTQRMMHAMFLGGTCGTGPVHQYFMLPSTLVASKDTILIVYPSWHIDDGIRCVTNEWWWHVFVIEDIQRRKENSKDHYNCVWASVCMCGCE